MFFKPPIGGTATSNPGPTIVGEVQARSSSLFHTSKQSQLHGLGLGLFAMFKTFVDIDFLFWNFFRGAEAIVVLVEHGPGSAGL